MLNPVLATRLVFILGITNLVGLALVFFTCRCLMGPKLAQTMLKIPGYQKFYRTHCRWWWLFFASVAGHSILAIWIYGIPLGK